uniref:ChSh domain-containing protein n=1 Tax=Steinernema glaseri TaxID=37863 RepID=A0A1I8A2X0_9BILA
MSASQNGKPKDEQSSSSNSPHTEDQDEPIYKRLRNTRPDLEIMTVPVEDENGMETEKTIQVSVRREGFNKGLEPLQIVSVTRCGEMTFMVIQFKDWDHLDLVPSSEALERCPKLVLGFFEKYVPYV